MPVPVPATGGRLFADGLVVMTYVEGGPPEQEADWRRVAQPGRCGHPCVNRCSRHVDVPVLELVLPHNAAGRTITTVTS